MANVDILRKNSVKGHDYDKRNAGTSRVAGTEVPGRNAGDPPTGVYGYLPAVPEKLTFSTERIKIPNFAGKGTMDRVTARCVLAGSKEFSFPFFVILPAEGEKHPFFLHINFRPDIPDWHQPTEELLDNGFAVLTFNYKDVTSDDEDMTDGLAGVLFPDGKRDPSDSGKIAMWAWAAQRIIDYAQTLSCLDMRRAVVCGHSRLGKTALLCGSTDTRFPFVYSNDSGCSGAAISRNKAGESVTRICTRFPYRFCEKYQEYKNREFEMPFDQHYLVASIAPRKVAVGSASEDEWADPVSEQLCCVAAAEAFPGGFVCPDRLAQIGEDFFDGDIGYRLRKGLHYFSREDGQKLIKFVNMH